MKLTQLIISSLLILGLGLALRTSRLDSLPIFADEAIYVRWAQVMRAEPQLRFLPQSDGKQPLYMWALMPVLKVFSDPLMAGRTLTALASLGTIAGVGILAFLLFANHRLSFIAAALYAVLPYAVFFERMALVDGFLVLFGVWYLIFMLLAIIRTRADFSMLAGFSAGFAWLTKSPAVFFIGLSPLLLAFIPKFTKRTLAVSVGLLITSWIIAFGMYNILRLGPQFHMIAQRNADYVYSLPEALRGPLDPLIPHLKDTFHFFFYLASPLGLLFAVWGVFEGQHHHLRQRLTLAAFWVLPVLAQSFIAKGFTARYLLFTVPFAVILIAHAIEHLGQKTTNHRLTYAAATLVIGLCLVLSLVMIKYPASSLLPRVERSGYLEEWTAGQGLKEVSAYIRRVAQTDSVVVGSEGFFGTPFDALALYLNDVPSVRVVGVGVWIDSVHEKLSSALIDNQVFLVVNSTRFHADPLATPGLHLISTYPKAVRPDGSREELLFFQVVQP